MPSLAQPIQQIVLSRFGGLYTEADPRDLPMGASPRNHDIDFIVGGIGPRPGLTRAIVTFSPFNPTAGANFPYVKSAILAASGFPPLTNPVTLAQSSDGVLWQELFTNPSDMDVFYDGILNNGRALSENVDTVEFIALSNLLQGVDQPRTWDGQFLDRVSQVGPGAGPLPASGGIGEVGIESITQPPQRAILSAGTNQTLGSVIISGFDPAEFFIGVLFTITGVTDSIFDSVGNLVNFIGNPSSPETIVYTPNPRPFTDSSGGFAQSQLATVTTSTPHNLMAGQSAIISGVASGMAYDGTWTVVSTPTPTTFTFNAPEIIGDIGPGGTVGATPGGLATGPRYAICMFVMRNGYITPASPPVGFTTFATDTFLSFSQIPIGPPACIGRIIAITPANAGIGGPYYYIPTGSGVFNSTVINDNVTTSIYDPTFSDAVLTAGINCTEVGFNVLQQREVGEYVKAVLYAGRVFYMGERVKVDNLYNLTFDGGTQFPPITSPTSIICGWVQQPGFEAWIQLITSPIYGQSLAITNLGAVTLNPPGTSLADMEATTSQFDINLDPFGVPTIRPNTDYSIRFTAWGSYGAVTGGASIRPALIDHDNQVILGPQLPILTQSPQEFVLPFYSPIIGQPQPTFDLQVLPYNVPPGESVYVDRIEIYPSQTPVYDNELAGSYLDNFQAVDSQTGPVDTSLFSTDPITNEFKFINTLYITTQGLTLSTNDTAGSEPDGWQINEVSNAVGCLGPLASDVGEEYVLVADRHGAYVFDGGNHVKFSQEIQQIWEQIYWTSANTTWIRNDLHQQRILIGVPMVTPNQYFPDAPRNLTPSTPNVILCCSVLGLSSGAEIAGSPGVHVSAFTGQLLSRDISRKWTGWYIEAPTCEWINRPNGSEQLWIGSKGVGDHAGTPQLYQLDPVNTTDDGAPIPQDYFTYGLGDEATTQQLQLGQARKMYQYMTTTIEGSGGMILSTHPEAIDTIYDNSQPPVTLVKPALDDVNLPLDESCNRLFLEFSTDGSIGAYFNLRRVVVGTVQHPKIPVSGI